MDIGSTQILSKLFDHINRVGDCNLLDCGIDQHHNLVFGLRVSPSDNDRLMTAVQAHPALARLVGRRKIISHRDIAHFMVPVTSGSVRRQATVAGTSQVQFSKPSMATSSGAVKLVLHPQGLPGFAEEINRQGQAYSLVCSVGFGDSFTDGIARAIADRAGKNYCRVSATNLLAPGQCFTYRCAGNATLASSKLNRCQHILNVHAPRQAERNFQQTLTNTFVNLFHEAHSDGVQLLLSCFVGCGQGGASGKELAQAIHAARIEFLNDTGVTAPSITLAGMNTPTDQLVRDNFISEWRALNKALPAAASNSKAPPRTATPAAALGAQAQRHILISGLLDVSMHADGGMFGAARELAKRGERFALVNAANEQMNHTGGIARQFARDLGTQFENDTLARPTLTGHCLTVGAYDYGVNPKHRLLGCQNIHNVVAPQKGQVNYGSLFRDAFVNLLVNASKRGNSKIVSCFFGCAIYGGNGTALARALHAAYQDPRVQSLAILPQLSLVGWSGSPSDQTVHDDFIIEFKRLQGNASQSVSAVKALNGKMAHLQLDEAARPKLSAKHPAGAPMMASSDKTITCGICMESKPETNSQTVNDLPICSECTEGYQASGVNLDNLSTLSEEFTAIRYEPLDIIEMSQPLPGHPGVGRIAVVISAKAPERLSDGKKVIVSARSVTHYLPDNPVGHELLRLLKVLHKHQLIFKLDHSNTSRQFGITFNFHLKTRTSGGEANHGYPDPDYPKRALNEIAGMANACNLGDELDVSRLIELIENA